MLAIIHARLITVSDAGIIEDGAILIDHGKIAAIGGNLAIPANAEIFDAAGLTITPGFIDAHCHTGVFADGVGGNHSDGNEMTDPVTPHMRALDALHPGDIAWQELMEAGVTTILTGPGSANIIGGQWICVKTQPKSTVEEMILMEPAGMKMALGENPRRVYGNANRMPSTRMGNAAVMREAFVATLNYMQKWQSYEKELAEYEKKSAAGDPKAKRPVEPDHNLKWDSLIPVLKGEMIARIHAHRADDILTAIRICEEFGVKFTIEHATEGYEIADVLAQKGIAVTVGPHLRSRSKYETRKRTLANPGILARAGVKVAIQTDDMSAVKFLPVHAAMAVHYGMAEEDALKAITINAAEIIGVADRVGSLETGKDADLVVLTGHPFDYRSQVQRIYINGEIAHQA